MCMSLKTGGYGFEPYIVHRVTTMISHKTHASVGSRVIYLSNLLHKQAKINMFKLATLNVEQNLVFLHGSKKYLLLF